MEISEYIATRLDDQIQWYSTKSSKNQKYYKTIKIIEMILAALITIITFFVATYPCLKIFIILSSALITIFTGIHGIYNFHENWIQYRAISETLKHEKYMYLTKAGVYNIADINVSARTLVERCESIISNENINWAQVNKGTHRSQKEDISASESSISS